MNSFYKIYTKVMARAGFAGINTMLLRASLHGLGIMNVEDQYSGEEHLIRRLVNLGTNPTIIDVGANVGRFSSLVRDSFPGAAVHAIEPHAGNFKKLLLVKGIIAWNLAMGNTNEHVELFDKMVEDGTEFASLYENVFAELHKDQAKATKVECMTLDSFCKDNDIHKIDLLKIDTEGHEFKILQGAKNLISDRAVQNILFEFNEMNTISGVHMRNFRLFLGQYDLFRLLPGGLLQLPESPLLSELYGFQNIFAVLKNS